MYSTFTSATLLTKLCRLAVAWCAISICCVMCAEPIPIGSGRVEVAWGTNAITVFTYKPKTYNGGPLMLVFHGLTRNAEEYRDYAIALADRLNAIVATPLFDKEYFSADRYVRGGVTEAGVIQPREKWVFPVVNQILADLRNREGKPSLDFYLFGHSAGGQFLMRLAALHPTEAKRIVAANPGSDLFPRRDWEYGYGFGGLPPEMSNDAALQRYLAAPLTIYLGTADINPDQENLDRTEGAMREGNFRLERGRACFDFAQKLARERGWTFNWRKVETPGIGHDGKGMLGAKEAESALFGANPPPPQTTARN